MVGSVADAEDLVQEAFVKAHRALVEDQFDGRSTVETWLYRIVTNACLDHLRSSKRRRRDTEPSDEIMAEDGNSAETRVALRELDTWMSDLAPEQRVALVLSAIEGFSNLEIAKLMGCSEGSVEQRLVRARAALRQRRNLEHEQN
jgi:RNA polymerase sigma-70 factor (ECF subfamily)